MPDTVIRITSNMLIKTRGIVLRAIKYSETSVIIDAYTEEKGMRSYIVSGVRTKNARVSASLLQPMTLLNMVVYYREGKELNRTKELSPAKVYQSLPYDLLKGSVGLFITELLQKTLKNSGEEKELFNFIFSLYHYLDQTTDPVKNVHLSFMLQYSAYLGFMPGGRYSEVNPIFDMEEGFFTPEPLSTHFLKPPLSQLLSQLLHCSIEDSHRISISRDDRKELLDELIKFYKIHVEELKTINAHAILEAVFGG